MRRSFGLGAAISALLICLAIAPSAGAVTFTVNTTADATPDGCTTASGGCTLREATEDANATGGDDSVAVPAGHYVLDGSLGPLNVDDADDAALRLAGAGARTTIIDGNGSGVVNVASASTLDASGITITGGFGCGCDSSGGAIVQSGAKLVLTDSRVTKNWAFSGGGITNLGGQVVLDGTEVDHNFGFIYGGGIASIDGSLTLVDSWVHDNQTMGSGGGIYSESAVEDECAECESPEAADPGAVAGTLGIASSTVSGNVAAFGAAGIYYSAGLPPDSGGEEPVTAQLEPGDAPTVGSIVNSTISGNSALNGAGGGVLTNEGSLDLVNDTIADNQHVDGEETGGAGLRATGGDSNPGVVRVKNTLLDDNRELGELSNCSSGAPGAIESLGNNLDSGDSCGFGAGSSNKDPLLGPLQDNGGGEPTHELLAGSPAIDTADNAAGPGLDQRGGDRPPGSGSAGATRDIGAYEAYSLADLAVESKTDGPDPATVGSVLTYTVVVRNNGPDRVNGVTLSDALPTGVTGGAAEVTGGGNCTGTYECEWASIDSGEVVKATFTTTAGTAGEITNAVTVGALGITDPDPSNNFGTAVTLVTPAPVQQQQQQQQQAQTLPPPNVPLQQPERDRKLVLNMNAPTKVDVDTFIEGILVEAYCTGEKCLRKFREHASINIGATRLAGYNLTVSRTSLGFNTTKTKVRMRPCLSGSTTGRRHRRCVANLRKAAAKAAPFRVKIVVAAVDKAGNHTAAKKLITVTP